MYYISNYSISCSQPTSICESLISIMNLGNFLLLSCAETEGHLPIKTFLQSEVVVFFLQSEVQVRLFFTSV